MQVDGVARETLEPLECTLHLIFSRLLIFQLVLNLILLLASELIKEHDVCVGQVIRLDLHLPLYFLDVRARRVDFHVASLRLIYLLFMIPRPASAHFIYLFL